MLFDPDRARNRPRGARARAVYGLEQAGAGRLCDNPRLQ
jgi:hypothetical protein